MPKKRKAAQPSVAPVAPASGAVQAVPSAPDKFSFYKKLQKGFGGKYPAAARLTDRAVTGMGITPQEWEAAKRQGWVTLMPDQTYNLNEQEFPRPASLNQPQAKPQGANQPIPGSETLYSLQGNGAGVGAQPPVAPVVTPPKMRAPTGDTQLGGPGGGNMTVVPQPTPAVPGAPPANLTAPPLPKPPVPGQAKPPVPIYAKPPVPPRPPLPKGNQAPTTMKPPPPPGATASKNRMQVVAYKRPDEEWRQKLVRNASLKRVIADLKKEGAQVRVAKAEKPVAPTQVVVAYTIPWASREWVTKAQEAGKREAGIYTQANVDGLYVLGDHGALAKGGLVLNKPGDKGISKAITASRVAGMQVRGGRWFRHLSGQITAEVQVTGNAEKARTFAGNLISQGRLAGVVVIDRDGGKHTAVLAQQ